MERKQEFNGGSSGSAGRALRIEELAGNTKWNLEDYTNVCFEGGEGEFSWPGPLRGAINRLVRENLAH